MNTGTLFDNHDNPIGIKLITAYAISSNHFRNDACDMSDPLKITFSDGPSFILADHLSKSFTSAESILTPGPIVVEIAIPFK